MSEAVRATEFSTEIATPHAQPHIGPLRAGVAFDILRRGLMAPGRDGAVGRNVIEDAPEEEPRESDDVLNFDF